MHIKKNIKLAKTNLINSWRVAGAFFGNNWTNVFSTILFSAVAVSVVNLIFARVDSVGGLSKDQLLFIGLFTQLTFYVASFVILEPLSQLVVAIREGKLDAWLVRPVPLKLFWITHFLNPINMLRDSIPSFIIYVVAINWNNIGLEPINLVAATLIFAIALYMQMKLMFALAAIAFWQGESHEPLNLTWTMSSDPLPFSATPAVFKIISIAMAPQVTAAILGGSVALGETSYHPWLLYVAIAAVIFKVFCDYVWEKGLRAYSSASS